MKNVLCSLGASLREKGEASKTGIGPIFDFAYCFTHVTFDFVA